VNIKYKQNAYLLINKSSSFFLIIYSSLAYIINCPLTIQWKKSLSCKKI